MRLILLENEKKCDGDMVASVEHFFDGIRQNQPCLTVRLKGFLASLGRLPLAPLSLSRPALRDKPFSTQQNIHLSGNEA